MPQPHRSPSRILLPLLFFTSLSWGLSSAQVSAEPVVTRSIAPELIAPKLTASRPAAPPAKVRATAGDKIFGSLRRWIFGGRPQPTAPSDRRRGGAARDECPTASLPLTALVPSTNLDLAREHTQTIAAHPTFWFYVPFSSEFQQTAEFALIDENEQDVYKQTFQLTGTPGIVSIHVPETATPLEPDQLYHWVFSVVCNPGNRSGDVAVDGWVKQVPVDDDLAAALQTATTLQAEAVIYADQELWHETLNTLIQLRQANPADTQTNNTWLELMTSIGLESIADQPLTPCCTPIATRPAP
jgi:Domain of Unknown Function (DUF928)